MTEVQKDSAIFAPITLKFKVWDRLKIYVFFDGLCKEEKKKNWSQNLESNVYFPCIKRSTEQQSISRPQRTKR